MKRNIKNGVTSVTAEVLPILIATKQGQQDGFGMDGSRMIPVKIVSREQMLALVRETPRGKTPRFLTDDEWRAVQAAHSLRNGLEGDELELSHAFDLLNLGYSPSSRGGSAQELWQVIALQRLAALMSDAKVVFWFDDRENQLTPGIFCPNRRAAVILPLLFGDSFHICPRCRKPFFSRNTYCSTQCQNAHRVARWRKKNRKRGQ